MKLLIFGPKSEKLATIGQLAVEIAHEALLRAWPRLRGWLHLGMAPIMQVACLTLLVVTDSLHARIGVAIYLLGATLLFGTSAVYHRGHWTTRSEAVLRRMDHANIFVFIAASYTPLALMLLSPASRNTLLIVVWAAALAGVFFNLVWITSPRWLHTLLYLLMGWAALGWLGEFWVIASLPAVLLYAMFSEQVERAMTIGGAVKG